MLGLHELGDFYMFAFILYYCCCHHYSLIMIVMIIIMISLIRDGEEAKR